MNKPELHNRPFEELIITIPDNSLDIILIDPPYLYLKNQKLEKVFDEPFLFSECKRVLKKDGFIIMFGRGSSFYRWNTILDGLGFNFKEEIVWDKCYSSGPLMNISRVHETVSIHSKGNGIIKKVKIPYLEIKDKNYESIAADFRRICTGFKKPKVFDAIVKYLQTGQIDRGQDRKLSVTVSSNVTDNDRTMSLFKAMNEGMNEKTIIKQTRDHYATIHPTQKPVRLLERLLQLVCKENDSVADFFGGSFSSAEACINLNLDFIGCEIDKEYFEAGKKRIDDLEKERQLKIAI